MEWKGRRESSNVEDARGQSSGGGIGGGGGLGLLMTIGRVFGKHAASIHGIVGSRGGVAPPSRRRAPRALSCGEREVISRGLAAGDGVRVIARALGRAPSTISREIARNAGPRAYRALNADHRAWQQAKRPKRCRLACEAPLRVVVAWIWATR